MQNLEDVMEGFSLHDRDVHVGSFASVEESKDALEGKIEGKPVCSLYFVGVLEKN